MISDGFMASSTAWKKFRGCFCGLALEEYSLEEYAYQKPRLNTTISAAKSVFGMPYSKSPNYRVSGFFVAHLKDVVHKLTENFFEGFMTE